MAPKVVRWLLALILHFARKPANLNALSASRANPINVILSLKTHLL